MANAEQIDAIINVSRVPDTIKLIPQYSGDRKGLKHWINIVDATLVLYEEIRGTRLYTVWMQQIGNKILGEKNDALSSAHVALN